MPPAFLLAYIGAVVTLSWLAIKAWRWLDNKIEAARGA